MEDRQGQDELKDDFTLGDVDKNLSSKNRNFNTKIVLFVAFGISALLLVIILIFQNLIIIIFFKYIKSNNSIII